MLSFILPLVITIIFALLTIIFLFISLYKEKSNGRFSTVAAIFTAVIALVSALSITVPVPVILPLDNETGTYTNSLEVTIKSDKYNFIKTYYTLDGKDPEEDGSIYKDTLIILETTTVCARNKFLWKWSEIEKTPYIIKKNDNNIQAASTSMENGKSMSVNENISNSKSNNQDNEMLEYSDDHIIIWEDKTFEKYIKDYFQKNDITYGDVKDIKSLYIMGDKIIADENVPGISLKIDKDIPEFISLNDLKYFNSLESLEIFHYNSINCDVFENYLTKLSKLLIDINLQSFQIKQITQLQSLENLCISRCSLDKTDLETIATMYNLNKLSVPSCSIRDISPIAQMTQLVHLDISYNHISNIDSLKNLKNLESIYLFGNEITDFSPVSHVEEVIESLDEFERE